jgi:hypothetical protein
MVATMSIPEPAASAVCLIPLLGPFHLRSPRYNAVTVRDTVAALAPDSLATTALAADDLDDPRWHDGAEIALPLALLPWAQAEGLELRPLLEPSPDPAAEADLVRYLSQYDKGREQLRAVQAAGRPLAELLERPLDLEQIEAELLPAIASEQAKRRELLGEGPGTDWLESRCDTMAERVLALPGRVALLAPADHLPALRERLASRVTLIPTPRVAESDDARVRGLLDFAMRGDAGEPGNVLESLREIPLAEARYHEANLLLAHGHPAEALERLETASHGDFSQPYFLPGYLLARLGQLRDLDGNRDGALRAYRGVRALAYAPADALEVAEAGIAAPFGFDREDDAEAE